MKTVHPEKFCLRHPRRIKISTRHTTPLSHFTLKSYFCPLSPDSSHKKSVSPLPETNPSTTKTPFAPPKIPNYLLFQGISTLMNSP